MRTPRLAHFRGPPLDAPYGSVYWPMVTTRSPAPLDALGRTVIEPLDLVVDESR